MKQIAGIFVTTVLVIAGSYSFTVAEKKHSEKPFADAPDMHETRIPDPPSSHDIEFPEAQAHEWPEIPVRETYESPMLVDREASKESMRHYFGPEDFGDEPGGRGAKTRQMIMWRLIEYLDLDEETSAKFFPVFKDHNKKRAELTRQHMEIVRKTVDSASDESVSHKELKVLVEKLETAFDAIENERKSFFKEAQKILDYRQYVKLVVFNDKLKKDLFNRFSRRDIDRMRSSRNNSPDEGETSKTGSELTLERSLKMLEMQEKKIEELETQIRKLQDKR